MTAAASHDSTQATFLIIGGVAGGMSAATRLRRLNEFARIIVVERSGYVSFANCGLPYYAGGVITERQDLLLQTPESLAARFGIEVLVNTEVTAIDPAAHTVNLSGPQGQSELRYDKLLLAPGAGPVRPPIPGFERALVVRTVEDIDAVAAALDDLPEAAEAVVIGGGFIGLEMAENLVHRGLKVTVVEAADQVMAPLDPEMAAEVHATLARHGVKLVLREAVAQISATEVVTTSGQKFPAQLVIGAIGVRPDTSLARAAGLEIGDRGGIVVNDQLETSAADIYAVGDAVEKRDAVDDSAVLVPLANTANLQGRMVAEAMNGATIALRNVYGTAVVGLFDMAIATTGWNEKRLRAAGKPYLAVHTHPVNHAGYYPGAEGMSLKLLVDPEKDEILGAQGVGGAGVDKRIDVIATAMQAGMKASALAEVELAYSPQFGSAKDPVNMLGFIVRNHLQALVETVQWHELDQQRDAGALILDVRTEGEFAAGNISGAINIPLDELRERLPQLREAAAGAAGIVVHCAVGLRGYLAVRLLAQYGIDAVNLDGGFRTYCSGMAAQGVA